MSRVFPVKQQFFDNLSALDSLSVQGSLLIDFSVIASIPQNMISNSSYGDIAVSVLVNNFEATASFGSPAFSLDLPVTLPSGDTINFGLTEASFSIDFFVNTPNAIDITELFDGDKDSAPLSFGGTLDANFPLTVGIAGTNIDVNLIINDSNLFELNPVVDYAINLCDVSATMSELFKQLKAQIVAVIEAPFGDLAVTVNIDKITDPLVSRVDSALSNFTDGINVALSSADCGGRRFLEEEHPSSRPSSQPSLSPSNQPSVSSSPSESPSESSSPSDSSNPSNLPSLSLQPSQSIQPSISSSPSGSPSESSSPSDSSSPSNSPSLSPTLPPPSFKSFVLDAITSVNEALENAGIVLSADVSPYFDSSTLSVGLKISLSATIEQTASEILELVSDYISSSTNSTDETEGQGPSVSKLGLGDSDDAPIIDLDELLSNVALAAGLDASFGVQLKLPEIQNAIFNDKPLDEALRDGISLFIDTWGAFAEIIGE